jgi:glycosyltransferase involved in cell wall biosynthesis
VGSVIFTGFVDDADLAHFYNAAAALVMPSYDEGFGLPALEAMACGTPVVASRAGALPEVVGEAGCFFNPHSPDELKDQLAQLLKDPQLREGLGRQGLQRAKEFSWERSARDALAIFEETVKGIEPAAA